MLVGPCAICIYSVCPLFFELPINIKNCLHFFFLNFADINSVVFLFLFLFFIQCFKVILISSRSD